VHYSDHVTDDDDDDVSNRTGCVPATEIAPDLSSCLVTLQDMSRTWTIVVRSVHQSIAPMQLPGRDLVDVRATHVDPDCGR